MPQSSLVVIDQRFHQSVSVAEMTKVITRLILICTRTASITWGILMIESGEFPRSASPAHGSSPRWRWPDVSRDIPGGVPLRPCLATAI